MRRSVISYIHRPSAGTIISLLALVIAMGGYTYAAPPGDRGNQEVLLAATSGGPVGNSDGGERIEIPLTDDSFTQRAGEAVVVAAEIDYTGPGAQDPPLASCVAFVRLQSSGITEERNETTGLAEFQLVTNGLNDTFSIDGINPPATDTTHELTADFQVFCEEVDPPEDFFTVNSLDVTILRLN